MSRVLPSHACTLPHEARYLACAPDRSRLALASRDGRFTVTDGTLRIAYRGTLPVPAGALAIHPTADVLAIASGEELVVSSFSGTVVHRRRHRRWEEWEGGDVAFLRTGTRLLAVCPGDETAVLLLIDAARGQVIEERVVDVPEPSGFHLVRGPSEALWALWAGAGQDGQWTYLVSVVGDDVSVEAVSALDGKEHGPIEFLRGSKEFLVAADGGLERRTLPAGALVGRLDPPQGDGFSAVETVCDVGARRALVTDADSSRLYVVDLESMALADELVIEGHEPRPFAELYPSTGNDGRDLCTDLWYLRGVPGAAAVTVHGSPSGPQTILLFEGPPLFAPER